MTTIAVLTNRINELDATIIPLKAEFDAAMDVYNAAVLASNTPAANAALATTITLSGPLQGMMETRLQLDMEREKLTDMAERQAASSVPSPNYMTTSVLTARIDELDAMIAPMQAEYDAALAAYLVAVRASDTPAAGAALAITSRLSGPLQDMTERRIRLNLERVKLEDIAARQALTN